MGTGIFTAEEFTAVRLSLWVAVTAVGVSLPLGIGVAWLLARRRFVGKTAIETMIHLPLVMPPVVTGYVLLVTFGRQGFIGRWFDQWLGWQFVFNWKGAALASAVMAFPLMVRSIRSAISAVDPRLEQAARTLGAGPWDTFFHVTLPLARTGVIAGAVLAFARGFGEFGATLMIAGNIPGETRTVPLEIYNLLESPGVEEPAWRLVGASIVIAAAAIAIGEYLERRGRSNLSMP